MHMLLNDDRVRLHGAPHQPTWPGLRLGLLDRVVDLLKERRATAAAVVGVAAAGAYMALGGGHEPEMFRAVVHGGRLFAEGIADPDKVRLAVTSYQTIGDRLRDLGGDVGGALRFGALATASTYVLQAAGLPDAVENAYQVVSEKARAFAMAAHSAIMSHFRAPQAAVQQAPAQIAAAPAARTASATTADTAAALVQRSVRQSVADTFNGIGVRRPDGEPYTEADVRDPRMEMQRQMALRAALKSGVLEARLRESLQGTPDVDRLVAQTLTTAAAEWQRYTVKARNAGLPDATLDKALAESDKAAAVLRGATVENKAPAMSSETQAVVQAARHFVRPGQPSDDVAAFTSLVNGMRARLMDDLQEVGGAGIDRRLHRALVDRVASKEINGWLAERPEVLARFGTMAAAYEAHAQKAVAVACATTPINDALRSLKNGEALIKPDASFLREPASVGDLPGLKPQHSERKRIGLAQSIVRVGERLIDPVDVTPPSRVLGDVAYGHDVGVVLSGMNVGVGMGEALEHRGFPDDPIVNDAMRTRVGIALARLEQAAEERRSADGKNDIAFFAERAGIDMEVARCDLARSVVTECLRKDLGKARNEAATGRFASALEQGFAAADRGTLNLTRTDANGKAPTDDLGNEVRHDLARAVGRATAAMQNAGIKDPEPVLRQAGLGPVLDTMARGAGAADIAEDLAPAPAVEGRDLDPAAASMSAPAGRVFH